MSSSLPSPFARVFGCAGRILGSLALLILLAPTARAETRVVLRLGLEPLALTPETDTPMVGGYVDDAITAYNAAARAYNGAHDYAPGSPMATAAIDRTAFAVHTTMLTFAPGIEAGGDHVYARLEGRVGLADQLHAIGVGVYPLNLAAPMRRGTVVPYLAAGGTVAWLDRSGDSGRLGGLFTIRVAAGVRISHRIAIEVGYSAYAFGGVLDQARLDTMTSYDPRGDAPPPAPDSALAGGEQHGMIDLAIGVGM